MTTQIPPLHVLHTPRLTLTLYNEADLSDIDDKLALFNDPIALVKQGDFGLHTRDDMKALTRICLMDNAKFTIKAPPANIPGVTHGALASYMVREGASNPSGRKIGTISLVQRGPNATPDMGWLFFATYHGKGYATEAAQEALRYWRDELGCTEMLVTTSLTNRGSYRIAEKLGFVKAKRGLAKGEDGEERTLYLLPGMKEPEEEKVFKFRGEAA